MKFGQTSVGDLAIARVTSDDPTAFDIREEDDYAREQGVVIGRPNAWNWHLVARKSGHQVLRLYVYSPLKSAHKIRSDARRQDVAVASSVVYVASGVWLKYYPYLLPPLVVSAAIPLLVVAFGKLKAKRERSKPPAGF